MFGTSILILALIQIFPSSILLWLETLQPSQLHQVASPSIWRSAAALPQVVARTAVCLRLLPPAHHTCVGGSLLGRREPSHPPASCLPALCLQRVASHRAAGWRDFGKSDMLESKPKPTDVAVRVAASVSLTRLLLLGSDSNCSDQTWSKKWRQL